MKTSHADQMIDITSPDVGCEVTITPDADGMTVWVNVDGVYRLRVSRVELNKLAINYRPFQKASQKASSQKE